jgi:putative hydrolase of the HAD superfamily
MAYLRSWAPTFRRETWSRALNALGVGDRASTAQLADGHRACFASRCLAYADVVPALERFSGSYGLAVITNGPADVQRAKLRTAGLERFFPTVVISSEIGYAKPHERAFAEAIRALGTPADEIVMVGDHLERDVLGAQRAGIRTAVWLDRTGVAAPPELSPTYRITQLGELEGLLGTI